MQVFYSPAYVGAAHAFDTTRKAAWIVDSLHESPIRGIQLREPQSLTEADVLEVHDGAYVAAVRTGEPRALAESQGFSWDPGLWPMVLASNGGAVAAARAALTDGIAGSLSSGLHHARRSHGAGFCTFNGLVLAAHAALAAGARSVLILDLDAHCGGGTQSLISRHHAIRHSDVAVHAFDHYDGGDRLTLVDDAAAYLPAVAARLEALDAEPLPGLCLYNAGMDPHEGCPNGGLPGITSAILAEREAMVFAWCRERGVPVAFVLAGGYVGMRLDVASLVALHRLTLTAAAY
ncbi:MAG TPA: hypothetical protein VM536_08665 [Chloroflexia bacterium]|nr:hypothetical protein [Chloroflexia bacterium]